MELLRGAPVAAAIQEEIAETMADWSGPVPRLVIIRVGERPDDLAYERGAVTRMGKVGFACTVHELPADIENDEFQTAFDEINNDPTVDGILLLRPLPRQLDEKAVEARIDPRKDVDGISPINLARVFAGDETGYAPCTAEAVIELLVHAGIELTGKRAVVVGRSLVIGKPVAMMLLKKNATVTICHTRTMNMSKECKNAEILIAAAGSARMLGAASVAPGAVVVDVGINEDAAGRLCGDVDLDAIADLAAMASPVPGGVGSVTTSVLAKHLLRAARAR